MRHYLKISFVTLTLTALAAACTNGEGLEFGDAGASAFAGAAGTVNPPGSAGRTGSAGTMGSAGAGGARTDAGPIACPAIGCANQCPTGYVTGANGCPSCQCQPATLCPARSCPLINCPGGYRKDPNGCVNQCDCAPLPACPAVVCAVKCAFGLKKDPSGCDLCECNPPPPCAPPVCNLSCPFGFAKGGNGCDTCQCAPPPPPPTCKPVLCKLACPNGYKKDASGCDICECNPAPICKPVACDLFCKFGYVKDANGCDTCRCNPMPVCPTLVCPTAAGVAADPAAPGQAPGAPALIAPPPPLGCVYGRVKDAAGCDTCQCNPPLPCTKEECGAAPPVPGCAPPSTMTGSTCVRGDDGKCAIVVTCTVPPGAACNQVRDRATCDKNAGCRWLEPGCVDPKLPAAGCYDRKDLDCSPQKPCTSGRVCANRVVNPCLPGSGAVCGACGIGIMICL